MKVFESYEQLLLDAAERLKEAEIADADIDAWYLLELVTGMSRASYFLEKYNRPSDEEIRKYEELLEKRISHIPLQHITGRQEFMGLDFMVSEDVLCPRQDTETLVESVLEYTSGRKVLDVCTGSGCIAVALMKLGNASCCDAVDLSEAALDIAKQNAEFNDVSINFIKSDMFEKIDGKYDIIVSNPPYIRPDVIETLMPEVREHEPLMALDGGSDGLDFYRIIAAQSKEHLEENGILAVEIGYDQWEDVSELFRQNGFRDIVRIKDLSQNDRVVMCKK
ncbi:MAG: peptide chain release factor N(5)-glutamine methyltransferase [Lachnospiraceae bacterium]|nr:peptide chain release factor N(5)-glutamine methyltransferase [Lachnospiraceae bacterium]MBQ2320235.1 peptide chain release factor N(5)-glutamine methyltransferase [Lachnospiraceae bacterium]